MKQIFKETWADGVVGHPHNYKEDTKDYSPDPVEPEMEGYVVVALRASTALMTGKWTYRKFWTWELHKIGVP